jgi:hypothetical protein
MDEHALCDLKLDAAVAVRAAMAAASNRDVVETFVKLAIQADLDDEEIKALRDKASAKRSGTSKRAITRMLQEARHEQAAERQYKAQQRALAERKLPRPRFDVPDKDASPQSVMAILDEVISYPIVRDSEGCITCARKIVLLGTLNPGPAQVLWSIRRICIEECAEMIEQYVEFVDKNGRSVHLPAKFVRYYFKRR